MDGTRPKILTSGYYRRHIYRWKTRIQWLYVNISFDFITLGSG